MILIDHLGSMNKNIVYLKYASKMTFENQCLRGQTPIWIDNYLLGTDIPYSKLTDELSQFTEEHSLSTRFVYNYLSNKFFKRAT